MCMLTGRHERSHRRPPDCHNQPPLPLPCFSPAALLALASLGFSPRPVVQCRTAILHIGGHHRCVTAANDEISSRAWKANEFQVHETIVEARFRLRQWKLVSQSLLVCYRLPVRRKAFRSITERLNRALMHLHSGSWDGLRGKEATSAFI